MTDAIQLASQSINSTFGTAPNLALVLGSGFSEFVNELNIEKSIPTADVFGAAVSTVQGHRGELILGSLKSDSHKRVLVVAGRVHGYEGNSPTQVVHIPRVLKTWGINKFILTNAAGSTSKKLKPGQFVLIKDHINFTGLNPLHGKELYGGDRFPDMSDLYSKNWRKKVNQSLGPKNRLSEAVYLGVNGPSYETAAEIKLFSKWGADTVGMSTVWESIALKQMGAEILGLSCVTNYGTGVVAKPLMHSEVLSVIQRAKARIFKILIKIIEESA